MSGHLMFVNQATNTLLKVKDFINAGMDTTLDVADDLYGENETTAEVEKSKGDELKNVMLDFIRMERELKDFLEAVAHTTRKAGNLEDDGPLNLESILDQKLADLQQGYNNDNLEDHDKFGDLLAKIGQTQGGDEGATPGGSGVVDDDIEFTTQGVNLKCPYTGLEMVDPVRNKHCVHSFDRKGILEYIARRGKKAKCPVGGCASKNILTKNDLVENKELRRLIERKGRQAGKRPVRKDNVFNL